LTDNRLAIYCTSQYDLHVENQTDDVRDDKETKTEEPVNKLLLKHDISTIARSKTVWRTQNPEYNELFLFHVPKNRLVSAYLSVTVKDRQLIGEDLCIGNITIPLGSLSITGIQSIPPQWFTIRKVHHSALFGTYFESVMLFLFRQELKQMILHKTQRYELTIIWHRYV